VILANRDLAKSAAVVEELKSSTNNNNIEVLKLDLGSFKSVRQFAAEFLGKNLPLHILINNAGIMAVPYGKTEDGWELQFGTNHLGHFLLTTLLLDTLLASAPSRVVALSSIATKHGGILWNDINFQDESKYHKWTSYFQSKTANCLFAVEMNRRYKDKGITCNAVHPGGILTGLQWNVPKEEQLAMGWIDAQGNVNNRFKSVEQGAGTSVWAAVAPELEGNGGHYCEDCSISGPKAEPAWAGCAPHSIDPQQAQRLWDFSLAAIDGKISPNELSSREAQKEISK